MNFRSEHPKPHFPSAARARSKGRSSLYQDASKNSVTGYDDGTVDSIHRAPRIGSGRRT
jgi:hypothetical protein